MLDEVKVMRQKKCAERPMGHKWEDPKADLLVCVKCELTIDQSKIK